MPEPYYIIISRDGMRVTGPYLSEIPAEFGGRQTDGWAYSFPFTVETLLSLDTYFSGRRSHKLIGNRNGAVIITYQNINQ